MTKENVEKLYKHFCFLASGDFTSRDFDADYGDGGSMSMGKLTSARIDLIKSDAKRHKEDMEKKYPQLIQVKQKEETKSKGKK